MAENNEEVKWAPIEGGADPSPDSKEFHRDPPQAERELLISKDIMAMPAEVRDRFKALKVLYDRCGDCDEEEEAEYRELERKYEKMYKEQYDQRAKIVKGEIDIPAELLEQYDFRDAKLRDDKFEEVTKELQICDVKSIQNTPKGVSDFWVRVLTANKNTAGDITEKDRPILQYFQDIKLDLHDDDFGFTLTFEFEKNHYFEQSTLTKAYFMSRPNVIEKCVGTEITWKPGQDPTHIKKTKKKNKKKVTVHQKVPSFFDLFQTLNMNKDEEAAKDDKDDDDDEEGDDMAAQMDEDMDKGNEIKDNIVPLALELYLGVIEIGDSDDDDDDDDDDDLDDDEMPKMPKGLKMPKGFGKGAGGKGGKGGKGPKPEDCKQQ